MEKLRAAPFSLSLGTIIVATVQGVNAIGNSVPSLANTGNAVVRTEPLSPATRIERVDSQTTDVQITVSYANLLQSETGGSDILSLDL